MAGAVAVAIAQSARSRRCIRHAMLARARRRTAIACAIFLLWLRYHIWLRSENLHKKMGCSTSAWRLLVGA